MNQNWRQPMYNPNSYYTDQGMASFQPNQVYSPGQQPFSTGSQPVTFQSPWPALPPCPQETSQSSKQSNQTNPSFQNA
jgi:hypothetical protein